MNRDDLRRLQAHRGFPAVSLRLPTHRHAPGNREDPTRLKNLVRRAEQALRERKVAAATAQPMIDRLESLQKTLDYRRLDEGLCIFVAPDFMEWHPLPETVAESVVLGETFLTRDLVRVLDRQPRYRLLLLSEKGTRLFEGWGGRLREVEGGVFPLVHEAGGVQPPEGFNRGVDPKMHANERLRRFAHRVRDELVARVNGGPVLPLFVAGVDRLRSYLREAYGNGSFAGEVEGNFDHATAHEISTVVAAELEAWQRARRQEVLDRYLAMRGTKHGASGLGEVGKAAAEGRVETLLVESAYSEPGTFDRRTGEVTWVAESGDGTSAEDVVDEVVETVLERGGEVVFHAEGRLSGAGAPIGAILRY